MLTQSIMRIDLINIGKASEVADHELMKNHIKSLQDSGPYTEASEDEIEAYDDLFESLMEN